MHLSSYKWQRSRQKRGMIRIAFAAALVALGPVRASRADPVVVNEGSMLLSDDDGLLYNFGSAHLAVQGIVGNDLSLSSLGLSVPCTPGPCAEGSPVTFNNSTSSVVPLGQANVFANGVNYGVVDLSGSFQFEGPTLPAAWTMPPSIFDPANIQQTAPFSFTGTLTGTQNGQSLFDLDLAGFGTATLSLAALNNHTSQGIELTYKFGTAATPEPASLLLLGTGAVGLIRRKRPKTYPPIRPIRSMRRVVE
ncbi:MAG TPA: PEP-CTERM sorting domain-containing protein [Vicinamibacterales bacterium]|jgi:hypothetical protein|nr:PEP-CTERM sorting domain-containing protein [Vicinamibacterales bacterium]